MSKNKKIIIIVAIVLVLCLIIVCLKLKPANEKGTPLFEFLNQDELNIDDIESVDYIRYTEGGDNTITYTEPDNIISLYNSVKSIMVGKETNRACEDNTTVYSFKLKDDKKFTVEIECSWLVIGNKRYEIVKD